MHVSADIIQKYPVSSLHCALETRSVTDFYSSCTLASVILNILKLEFSRLRTGQEGFIMRRDLECYFYLWAVSNL